ncbi:unnamed protein product [Rhodiola kirilowii]
MYEVQAEIENMLLDADICIVGDVKVTYSNIGQDGRALAMSVMMKVARRI